jgi:hypothetical protein
LALGKLIYRTAHFLQSQFAIRILLEDALSLVRWLKPLYAQAGQRIRYFSFALCAGLIEGCYGHCHLLPLKYLSILSLNRGSGSYPIDGGRNDRVDMKCVRVNSLIQIAHGVRDFQIVGGPKWLRSGQYDLAPKITSSSDDDIAAQGKKEVN